ncbi:DUF6817 domain-containing protein [Cryptosporangium minutisporangium]|uniref:DUF6817 domain-containing protein n=1 Tax=Cryptosporangium minutisporangium TaxID=113569 RepID=A0ABP6TEE0_9ACTN
MTADRDIRALLRARGAESVPHPGGTLYEHLGRVADRLARHGASADLRRAGLAHAVYGTDGFDVSLVALTERHLVQEAVGPAAEAIVYRYGGCDRTQTWSRLAATRCVVSRFTGDREVLDDDALRDFVDLTLINELDVLERSADVSAAHRDFVRSLVDSWADLASPTVVADAHGAGT